MKKFLLSIFCCLMAAFAVQAQEPVYTLEPAVGSNNSYAGNCDITIDGITWNLTGNSQMIPWRIGGKNLTNVDRALYSKTPIASAVSKVVLTLGTYNLSAVNSAKLLVADNADFTNSVEYSFTFAASSDIEIPVSAAANSYYKFVFNVTAGSSNNNRYLQFAGAKFYAAGEGEEGGEEVVTLEKPIISPDGTTFNDGETLSVEITAEDGATIYYTLDGNDPTTESTVYSAPFSITETTTVKAIAVKEGCNDSEVAEATYTAIDPSAAAFEIIAEELGYANGVAVETLTFGDVTATFDKGTNSNTPKYYTTGKAIRAYGGNAITFTGAAGVAINKIQLTFGSGDGTTNEITADCGTYSDGVWDGSSNNVVLTIGGTSGHRRIATIKVTYSIESASSYTLTVGSTGYATLFLDYATTIPAGVKCYAVSSLKDGYAMLNEVADVLPANTAVIVNATAGEYAFTATTETDTEITNLLKGTAADEYITEEAYVLSAPNGEVGLYKAAMTDGSWLNNANKAYLPASVANGAASYSFSFDWGGTTGIENIEGAASNSFGNGAIYDITGRKINAIAVSGIYIIDGKKVFIRK